MTLTTALTAAKNILAAKAAVEKIGLECNDGTLKFYTTPVPASPAEAISTQTLLATCTFGATAFGSGTSANPSVATANAIADEAGADASGDVAFVRVFDGATVLADLTVGLAASGADVIMDSLSLVEASPVGIASCTISQTAAG